MSMKAGVPYSMSNTVIEFEQDRRIAWKTVLLGIPGALPRRPHLALRVRAGGRRDPGPGELGHLPGQAGHVPPAGQAAVDHRRRHVQDVGPPGRAGRDLDGGPDDRRSRDDRRGLGRADPPHPGRLHPHPVPLPRVRRGLGRPRRHHRGRRAPAVLGTGTGRGPAHRDRAAARAHARPAGRERRHRATPS